MTNDDTKTYSLSDVQEQVAAGDYVKTKKSAKPQELDADFWDRAQVVLPNEQAKVGVSLRVDPEVYEWFKSTGRGYLTRMNAVLKAYVAAQGEQPTRKLRS